MALRARRAGHRQARHRAASQMQQHQCALDGAFPPPRHRRRAALRRPAARCRARLRLRDAVLRARVRPPAAPLLGLADAGNSQQRLADRARARAAPLRRALVDAGPFRLAARCLCRARRPCHCRDRAHANRRTGADQGALSARHRRRQQHRTPGARLSHDRRGRQHPSRLHGRHDAVLLHPRADAARDERAAADQHDLDSQSRDEGHDVFPGRARDLGRGSRRARTGARSTPAPWLRR